VTRIASLTECGQGPRDPSASSARSLSCSCVCPDEHEWRRTPRRTGAGQLCGQVGHDFAS
jgi:hypothetical protein